MDKWLVVMDIEYRITKDIWGFLPEQLRFILLLNVALKNQKTHQLFWILVKNSSFCWADNKLYCAGDVH